MSLIAIYSIISLGMSLLLGYAGQISLGHAAFFGIGAYTSAILTVIYGWPTTAALFASVIITALIAYLIGKPILKLRSYFLALATLGFGEIFFIFAAETKSLTRGWVGIGGIPWFSIFGFEFDNNIRIYYLTWSVLLGLSLYSYHLVRSRSGRALRAICTDEIASSTLGIDVADFKVKIFTLSGAYAGLAGSLFAFFFSTVVPTSFTVSLSIYIVIVVIIGGMGTLEGPVIGALILTWLTDWLSQFAQYSMVIYGFLLILILIFMPQGIQPAMNRLFRRFVKMGNLHAGSGKCSQRF
ncbi:MAG: branched-chain amino acid ABC transporter permease [Thermodesulfobacteriota bacterium]|nr:branched-chain amino acid ABC transporter permease [Thermodesulfobacteriota bacterium]